MYKKEKLMKLLLITFLIGLIGQARAQQNTINWVHLSSKTGDIESPNLGKEQCTVGIADFDKDGINDFSVSGRTARPSMVWYHRTDIGWDKYVIDTNRLSIEAGTCVCDVDCDGDIDIITGGDSNSNQLWWWENPYPNFEHNTPWHRYLIRNTGGNKMHDQMVGDFDGDGKTDLVFWAQGDQTLYFTRVPSNPKLLPEWRLIPVYKYYNDGQMEQHGTYPPFKGTNEHEGLAKADIDGDGVDDIVGGGIWFKFLVNDRFSFNTIDAAYTFSRSSAGQLIKGGRPEVVLVVGDGWAPMYMYEYQINTWVRKEILPKVSNGHSLDIVDFDGDGNLDIWNAEMTLGGNTNATNRILYGDGKGNFKEQVISQGIDNHGSKIADLDGDGDLDILDKPYDGDTPRLDIWLQNGTGPIVAKRAHSFNSAYGLELNTLRHEFAKDIPATVAFFKASGFEDFEVSGFYGKNTQTNYQLSK